MTDFSIPLLSFLVGSFGTAAIAYFLHGRQSSALLQLNATFVGRISELEVQSSRRAEEASNQRTAMIRAHSDELDRVARERRQLEEDQLNELKVKVREAQDRAFEDGKRQAELRADENAKAFSLTVRPYIRKIRDDSFIRKLNRLEIGYQYQLLINGFPCFDPHVVIEQHYEEKEVNQEVIERMSRIALEVAKAAVAIQAGPAGAFIPISTTPVIEG
jgi:hypothetical protein